MEIMNSRAVLLQSALQSLNNGLMPYTYIGNVASGDDMGIYYFIPLLAHFLHTNAAHATEIFWMLVLGISALVSFASIFVLYKNWITRIVSLYLLYHLCSWVYHIGDLYIAAAAIAMALIPLSIYLVNREQSLWIKASAFFLCGITIGIFHYIRSYSEFPVLIFILVILLFNKNITLKLKAGLVGLLAIGILIPCLFFTSLIQKSEVYNHNQALSQFAHHPFWHPVYLGLGYLPNPYGIVWDDQHGIDKARSVNKDVVLFSPAYEAILKAQVILVIEQHPLFVAHTELAKIHALFSLIKKYFLVALLFSIFFPKGWRIEIAFWSLLFLSALPGLLVMPETAYVLGFIAAAIMYMLVSMGHALDCLISPIAEKECRHNMALNFLAPKLNTFLAYNNQFSRQLRTLTLRLAAFLDCLTTQQHNSRGDV